MICHAAGGRQAAGDNSLKEAAGSKKAGKVQAELLAVLRSTNQNTKVRM